MVHLLCLLSWLFCTGGHLLEAHVDKYLDVEKSGLNFIFLVFHFGSHVGKPHLFSSSLVTWGRGNPQATLQTSM